MAAGTDEVVVDVVGPASVVVVDEVVVDGDEVVVDGDEVVVDDVVVEVPAPAVVEVVEPATAVMPQTDCPTKRSPTAVGPSK